MIEGVNVGHALIAGFFAAFLMSTAAYWLEGVFGLPRIDLGMVGQKYMGGDRPGWWFVGQASHYILSMGLALVYASGVALNLEDLFGKPLEWWWGPPAGMVYGLAVFLILPVGIVGSITVLSIGILPRDPKALVANVLLHLLWGATLGALYFPVR